MNLKIIIPAILGIALLAYYFVGGTSKEAVKPPAVAIKVAPVAVQDMPIVVTQVGTVVANQTVAVRSRVDSQIMEVKFHDGDAVHAGDVLFVLDDRTLSAQLRQEKANLVNLQAQYERTRALIKKQYVSQADLDQAKAAYEAQKAVADSLATQLEYTRITAPIDGRTGTINVTVGNTVKANDTQPLVTINQLKPIRVQLSLPQQYLETVRTSMASGAVPVAATHDGASSVSQGNLEYIDNAVDSSTGTFAARAQFANDDESLWPGMFVNLKLTLGSQSGALTVPEVAVQHGQSGDFVFVITDGKAVKTPVKVARMQDDKAVIDSGLDAKTTVATDGMMSLKDGGTVTINQDDPNKTPVANEKP